jgi:hypothetical protein
MAMLATNIGCMLLFIISFISGIYSYDESETNCLEKNRLTGSEAEDMQMLVEAMSHETVKLECHFWYKILNFKYLIQGYKLHVRIDNKVLEGIMSPDFF